MLIYFWANARDRVQAAEGQTEGDTESEAGSRLPAVSAEPDVGLKLMNREIMTWAEVWCLSDWATQVPQLHLVLNEWIHFYPDDEIVNMTDEEYCKPYTRSLRDCLKQALYVSIMLERQF